MNNFPKKDCGFDAVVHSSVPFGQNLGAEISLTTAFYTFLGSWVEEKDRKNSNRKALFCKRIKEKYGGNSLGSWDSFTSVLAENRDVVVTDCR